MSGDRDLDVVVFGATGFVGRLVAGYLAGHAPGGVRIGLAGRSERRLADVRAQLGAAASAWPLLVADSADSMKRNRGRRGLDILQKIQKMAGVEVSISDLDFPDVREVDLKLIELARALQGKIVTNDFNLNKVAQLRGVDVLNVIELANSLKPVVLPGEIMKVFILKEGKEYNQGVAYLDDGTMVVVDNARKMISKTIDIVVTSVLQTTAGKMIFGRFIEAGAAAHSMAAPQPVRTQAAAAPQVSS